MYRQVYDPVSSSLGWSTLLAVLPLVTLFVLLGGLRWKAQWAALASLAVAIVVAVAVYSMPAGLALNAAGEGAAFGLFPIMWIVVNALWIFNMTRESGHFAVMRRSFGRVSDDQRVQAVLIAFCFGALMEALAGFGTPVAISAIMLVALGFEPMKAAAIALVANTAPVAFGAIAVPITTLAQVTGLPEGDLGAMVGRQTPFLALIVPLILVFMVDGRRGVRETWPVALLGGAAFGVGQFVCSNYLSVPLTDIVAALASTAAIVGFLRVWHPAHTRALQEQRVARQQRGGRAAIAGGSAADPTFEQAVRRRDDTPDSRRTVIEAYAPYAIIIAVFALAQLTWLPIKDFLDARTIEFSWPGLDVLNGKGEAPTSLTYKLNWAAAAGTLLLLCGLLTMLVIRLRPGRALRNWLDTVADLRWAIVTVASVLALAYVMNLSGQTITIGMWLAGAGGAFAFLSPLLGWFGVAVTGSDTSSNSLFGALQVAAASKAHLSETLLAASNSSGGVLGKMISPQNLAIGAAAVGMAGREGDLFRTVLKWSLLLLLVMCVLAFLQSTVLEWMVT
jgi:lactate permease